MLSGAYSSQYKVIERQHVDTIKTLAENEKSDAIARAKKLSFQTNKRRRALAIKRKTEAEREEKRRQQILAKRREKQQEATEKFQRSHVTSRPNSGTSNTSNISNAIRWSPRRSTFQLEDALKAVRGSPGGSRTGSAKVHTPHNASPQHRSPTYYRQNSDPLSKPYFNKYAHPSINGQSPHLNGALDHSEELHNKSLRNYNNSRTLFEQQLETYQQTLIEQQQKSLREFNQQVMQELETNGNGVGEELRRSESLSSVDSLEEETGSNDTLRDSCELDTFLPEKQSNGVHSLSGNIVNGHHDTKTVSFANTDKDSVRVVGSVNNNPHFAANSQTPQNIDSYNAQIQALLTPKTDQQKQQFFAQRQKEIQQQLLEQEQRKQLEQQQKNLQEQQRKQQLLLQQQFEKHQQEQQEQVRLLEQQHLQQQQQQQQQSKMPTQVPEEEGQRPKAQLKAWATPSPHPPATPSSTSTPGPTLVTHASPYSGKNTHTNMTVPLYDRTVSLEDRTLGSNGSKVVMSGVTSGLSLNNTYNNNTSVINSNRAGETVQPLVTKFSGAQDNSLSFLETVTNGLMKESPKVTYTNDVSTNSSSSKVPPSPSSATLSSTNQTRPSSNSSNATVANSNNTSKPVSVATVITKPPPNPAYYGNSYGAAYAAKQQQQQQQHQQQQHHNPNNSVQSKFEAEAVSKATSTMREDVTMATNLKLVPGVIPWGASTGAGGQNMMTPNAALNGDDIADTDSVSTICDDRDTEPKEVKSILKPSPSKKGGILKKSGSTGDMKDIRDSLEITRVHLQTSAEEKEQRPSKKNVRFADMTYDDEPEHIESDEKLFVQRDDSGIDKPPRPVSAVTPKINGSKTDGKPPRATSSNQRTSTIPRPPKMQIVKPQAAAHIITQGTQNGDPLAGNEKFTVVNSNFIEKVPAMARANQTALTVAPVSVYTSSTNYARPEVQQKVNYAVSSVVMPRSENAPFLYNGGYTTGPAQGSMPQGSVNGPVQATTNSKYEDAVYDDNGLRIDRTPTDDEINFLWDKLRTCLHSRNSSATPEKGPTSEGQHGGPRQAAPVAHTYIDGNALGQFNSLTRVAANQPGGGPMIRRQNSLDSASNSYTRRYGLLQRKQQPNPNSLKSRQMQQGYTVFQAPFQSQNEPQSTNVVLQNGTDVTESMAGFLTAEQLSEQSVSESRIQQAIDEAQARQQAFIAARPSPKVKSALSIEEQRLLQSLDRLNEQLQVTEGTIPADGSPALAPNFNHQQQQQHLHHQQQHQRNVAHRSSFLNADGKPMENETAVANAVANEETVSGFKGHAPLSAQRRVIETGNHKAKLRITTAALKRNIHRQQ